MVSRFGKGHPDGLYQERVCIPCAGRALSSVVTQMLFAFYSTLHIHLFIPPLATYSTHAHLFGRTTLPFFPSCPSTPPVIVYKQAFELLLYRYSFVGCSCCRRSNISWLFAFHTHHSSPSTFSILCQTKMSLDHTLRYHQPPTPPTQPENHFQKLVQGTITVDFLLKYRLRAPLDSCSPLSLSRPFRSISISPSDIPTNKHST